MKFQDEYRHQKDLETFQYKIQQLCTRSRDNPWRLMEVCGGQTHSIVKYGLDQMLPGGIELLHGPGCPVCVTPVESIEAALAIAAQPGVMFCTYGDMLKVPGAQTDLARLKAQGAKIHVIYSPLEALELAVKNPQWEVVLYAIGFETTAPSNAAVVLMAEKQGLKNFSLLVSQVLVPPALRLLMEEPNHRIDGFLAAGHVCTVAGEAPYRELCKELNCPIVITGFEPLDLMQGIWMLLSQLESHQCELENQYTRTAHKDGNPQAQAAVLQVFEIYDGPWRGLGSIKSGGLRLRSTYAHRNALLKFLATPAKAVESACPAGQILRGQFKPGDCPLFGKSCTPEHPLGPTMISGEGSCSTYYRFRGESYV